MPPHRPLDSYIDRNGPGGCWLWLGDFDRYGYGKTRVGGGGRSVRIAHRVVYETFVGQIPDEMQLDHLCRVKECVNPAHLEPVTFAENVRRYFASLTHCRRGHEYNQENTRFAPTPSGGMGRTCRVCQRENQRLATARRRDRAA